jgi:hypothetical protein
MDNSQLKAELEPLVKVGAKLYLREYNSFGQVTDSGDEVKINIGTKKEPMPVSYERTQFFELAVKDRIVARHRCEFNDNGDLVNVKPSNLSFKPPQPPTPSPTLPQVQKPLEGEFQTGFINEKTGKFSTEPKRGYSEIRFQKVKKEVTLQLSDEQIEQLKELGVL